MSLVSRFAWLLLALPCLSAATPPNTTPANAVFYELGQGWVTHAFDEATQSRWFRYREVPGHSYCIEIAQGAASPVRLPVWQDPSGPERIALYADETGTATLKVGMVQQPITSKGSLSADLTSLGARTCYVAQVAAPNTAIRSFVVHVPVAAGSGDVGFVRIRVVDTTLVATCFSSTSHGMGAQLSNRRGVALPLTIQFFANTFIGPASAGSLAAYQTNDSAIWGPPSGPSLSGVCKVAHSGPPDSLHGFVRSLDPAEGVLVKHPLTTVR